MNRLPSRRIASAVIAAAILLSPFLGVQACGPDFEPAVFVRRNAPDNLAAFGHGQLGILQAGYDSDEYAVAYRYLNGGKLSAAEHEAYAPAGEPAPPYENFTNLNPARAAAAVAAARKAQQAEADAHPPNAWLLKRAEYLPGSGPPDQEKSYPRDYDGVIVFDFEYLNCPDGAFQNALVTLKKRADAWGRQSPWLRNWLQSQDAVFSNCAGKSPQTPAPAPDGSPALLRQDRAYQLASAAFYAKKFDEAAQQYQAIAQDKSSPWAPWGQYLAARATVRKAFASGKATQPYSGDVADFDAATMSKAQQMLESLLAQRNPVPSRETILAELNFVRIRSEPARRVSEICAALTGPAPDADFKQDLADLNYVLVKHLSLPGPPPLLAWIAAWRTDDSAAATTAWKQTPELPWMILALAKAAPADDSVPQLLAAAQAIKPDSPAYDTVFYHRIRLLTGLNRFDEVRSLLDRSIPALRHQPPGSNLNTLLAQRMAIARTFPDFLEYAPRTILSSTAAGDQTLLTLCPPDADWVRSLGHCPTKDNPPEFDEDSVAILNRHTPLDLLVEASTAPTLPPNMRNEIVLAAWTRSVVLEEAAQAAKLAPLLPDSLRRSASTGLGFQSDLAILRNPGLRPYLEPGVSRLANFAALDNYRDNWWSSDWSARGTTGGPGLQPTAPSPAFLTPAQRTTGEAQYKRLIQQPVGATLIGRRVVNYAKDHRNDPEVPEALAMTVRATHYSAQHESEDSKARAAEMSSVSKAAFQLLHSRYPNSPWTSKTPYYY